MRSGALTLAIALLVGCSVFRSAPVGPDGWHGEPVERATEVPDFVAINSDGAPRSRADLLGHPTVIWFFPAASSPG